MAPVTEIVELVTWLTEDGFKQTMRPCQWAVHTDKPAEQPTAPKRRKKARPESEFVIREIGPYEANTFARIVAVNYRFKQGIDLGWWERQVGAPGCVTFVAFEGDEPIGTGMLHGDGRVCVLGYGTTLKAYRKRGLQNAMIATRLQKARELGYSLTTASTFGTDQSSRNLRRQGFELVGEVGVYAFPAKGR